MIPRHTSILAVILGVVSSGAQLFLVREFMSSCGGNELVLIFVLTGWLGGIALGAGNLCRPFNDSAQKIPWLFLTAGILCAVLLIGARLFKVWLGIPPGQIMDPVFSGGTGGVCMVPLGVVYGAVFRALLYLPGEDQDARSAGRLYALEALGFAAGGILGTGILWLGTDAVLVVFILLILHLVLFAWGTGRKALAALVIVAGIGLGMGGAVLEGGRILTRWQWPGFEVLSSRDSVLGRVTIVRRAGQVSAFENGILAYSANDRMSAEEGVHYALVAHAAPRRVLVIGGGPGCLFEVLKDRNIRADYVDADPLLIGLVREFFPGADKAYDDPRVRVVTGDARRVVKEARQAYDVILLNLPDPVTILINRYYTQEFFGQAARALKPGGILACSASSSANYLSREGRDLLGVIATTLRRVFGDVRSIPGDRVIFLASSLRGAITLDVPVFAARLKAREVATHFVHPSYLSDRMSPLRMSDLARSLAPPHGVNSDGRPYGFMKALVFASTHFGGRFSRVMAVCENAWGVVLGLVCVMTGIAIFLGSPGRAAARVTVFVLGFTGMMMQAVLLLYFQAMYGYLFGWLGLLTASFMVGVFCGGCSPCSPSRAGRDFRIMQGVMALCPFMLAGVWGGWLESLPQAAGLGIFLGSACLVGVVGGRTFLVATAMKDAPEGLYAADVLGALLGTFWGGVVALPVLGAQASLVSCWAMGVVIWGLTLIRRDRPLIRKNALL